MAYKENAETLSVEIEREIYSVFQKQWKDRRQVKNGAVEAAVKLWIELPIEVQARLLDQTLEANSFVELVQEIVDERIESGRKAAQKLVGRQSKKRNRKG